ncbi:MAG TPA: hypothetical protein VFX65_14140 [Candidatus Limnocylindrales bacterium]|nr:hypothetical protein [Candidatus Limnocylindrales bacterium]
MLTPLLDRDEISAQVLRRVAGREPRLERLAVRHLARLTPDRWTIEWHLPAWLGRRFELEPAFVEALVQANVLGLLAIRLEDDLEDGEVAPSEIADTRVLARLALDLAVGEYAARFGAGSPLWTFLDRSMAEWRAGASGIDLAVRGAPLKIAGFAACLQADRLDLWPTLERSLDGAVTALVLYDQFCDWEADLTAGRWNAFVASIVGGPRRRASPERDRAMVLAAMLTGPVVREHFDRAVRAARDAAAIADDLEVSELEAFLTSWAARTSEQGAQVADHYQHAGDQAARLLLGTTTGGTAT